MCDKKLFSCGFLCCTIHNMYGPNHTPLKTTCHRLRKRWDENTLLNKRPHKAKTVKLSKPSIGHHAPPSSSHIKPLGTSESYDLTHILHSSQMLLKELLLPKMPRRQSKFHFTRI